MERLVISSELEAKLQHYCDLLEEQAIKEYPDCVLNHHKFKYNVMQKFIKVIKCDYKGNEVSVYCFVDSDGNLYKADGWTRPAKGVRGHIDSPILDGYGFYRKW